MRILLTLAVLTLASDLATANVVTLAPSKDNTLYAENQTFSNGAGTGMFAGPNGVGFQNRALLAFDVAANVPAGSTINSVTLTLVMNMTNSGPLSVDLRRTLADWGEGTSVAAGGQGGGAGATTNDATWQHRFFPSTLWTTLGGDFSGTSSSTTLVDQNGTYIWPSNATFVSDVQSFLNTPSGNFGWTVMIPSGGPAKRFATREFATVSSRPMLTIDFTPPVGTPFCFGDGSGAACPCTNSGASGSGCASSSHPSGANLTAVGAASIAADTLIIQGTNMSSVGGVLYFQGSGQQAGGAGTAFGDGLLCAGGAIVRLGVKINVGGASQFPDVGDPSLSLQGGVTTPGTVQNYQGWYRDSAAFCTAATFNLTNGFSVTWGP
ncbi:MAG: DNRLRE domain-containing protein [Planctomycetota bacterium]|nr:DNRLRE domain-containing protein [Planctomycetota bacterium]